jgi:hypothetical protein
MILNHFLGLRQDVLAAIRCPEDAVFETNRLLLLQEQQIWRSMLPEDIRLFRWPDLTLFKK